MLFNVRRLLFQGLHMLTCEPDIFWNIVTILDWWSFRSNSYKISHTCNQTLDAQVTVQNLNSWATSAARAVVAQNELDVRGPRRARIIWLSAEETYKARMAIRFIILFLERALVELTLTKWADEMLRVVLAVHGRDAAAGDWLVTAGA